MATESLRSVVLWVFFLPVCTVLLTPDPANAGSIAYWRFENGTANSSASGVGSILDSTGNGHNGTPINGPLYRSSVPSSTVPQTRGPE
jgi:hypothetical protein